MDSHHTGSDELVYIQTEVVSVTIKGRAAHPEFQEIEYTEKDSSLEVYCVEEFECSLKGGAAANFTENSGSSVSRIYTIAPLFYEQQRYEIVIETNGDHRVEFWHDNFNIRKQVTKTGRLHGILSGVINFGNEIGYSDLVIRVDGSNYLRLRIEVFPTKIDYKEDYQALIEDVTREVYSLIFDFLKKTYLSYRQSDRVSSTPVVFFAVIRRIFNDFMKAADLILSQPHHMLETTHAILPRHKVKRIDNRGLKWMTRHPDQVVREGDHFAAERALAVKKQITYDTKENRMTKHILESTARKLESFQKNYRLLQRQDDKAVVKEIDDMIRNIRRRTDVSFLADVSTFQTSSGMSLVFSMAPGYRDLYKFYLMLLRGLSITGDVFNISIKDLAALYEYWCFIKLNSLMKCNNKYRLVSQDIIKVQGNGLYVSLVKGSGSRVSYRDIITGERIDLSYNPQAVEIPTVSQRPDNVLTLEKKGSDIDYQYVFDAKYRINPALPESDYYNTVSHHPGPEVGDINTMHRYRDAIVYHYGAKPYERTMFGAYVLFPYRNEEEYKGHKFFKSIDKVNIGGLPFLPSATNLVSQLLENLITESPSSAYERSPLPRGVLNKLKKTDWAVRDVLVGSVKNDEQFDAYLTHRCFVIQATRVKETALPIRTVALYQPKRHFGSKAGISFYGEVISCDCLPQRMIEEIPGESDELYYRLTVKAWKSLPKRIEPKETGNTTLFTNRFLLEHSGDVSELCIRSEEEYRLFSELKRAFNSVVINDEDIDVCFRQNDALIVFENGKINVYRNGTIIEQCEISDFGKTPGLVFRKLRASIAP